jgi:hypothetical protein
LPPDPQLSQGTAFFLKDFGLITCDHVVADQTKAFYPRRHSIPFSQQVVRRNPEIDLAVLRLPGITPPYQLSARWNADLTAGESIEILGWPDYHHRMSILRMNAAIVNDRFHMGYRRCVVDRTIPKGTSGGPVLDKNGKVIGVVAREDQIIPIDLIKSLLDPSVDTEHKSLSPS